MGLFDGILYRRREDLTERSHPALEPWQYWGGPSTYAATGTALQGWPTSGLTAALAVPVIFRCVNGIASKIAKFVPIATRDDEPVEMQPTVLRRPDPFTTRKRFLYESAAGILSDRTYWLLKRGARDRVISIELLRPSDVSATWADYRQTTRTYRVHNVGTFAEGEVVELAYHQTAGQLVGQSPLAAARAVWEGQAAADGLAASNFRDGTFPSGTLTNEMQLGEKVANEAKLKWMQAQAGTREPAVLTGGWKFDALAVVARDAQWIEHRQWTAGDLARLFGYPAGNGGLSLPVGGSNLTYSNVREVRTDVLIEACEPVMLQIACALEQWVLPLGQELEWDTSKYLPPLEAVENTPGVNPAGVSRETDNEGAADVVQ